MVVIGGRNSSNTTRLAEICAERCVRTHHIESVEDCARTRSRIARAWGDGRRFDARGSDPGRRRLLGASCDVASPPSLSSRRIPTPSCKGVRSMATYPSSDIVAQADAAPACASRRGASRAHRAGGARFACRRCGLSPGCYLTSVDGRPLRDIIDWRWFADGDVVEVGYIDLDGERHGRAGARRGERTGVFRSTACCSTASSFAATPARSAL